MRFYGVFKGFSDKKGGETPLFKAVQFKQAHLIDFLLIKAKAGFEKPDKVKKIIKIWIF